MRLQKTPVHTLYLLLGSNLGNSVATMALAKKRIAEKLGPVRRMSSLYQTAAWGKTDQPDFINQVIIIDTQLPASRCMQIILDIEKDMGRVRSEKNAARVIDIDILYYDKSVISMPGLEIPHPRISLRRFVLVPLNELSPRFTDPVTGQSVHEMLLNCPDKLDVKKI